MGIFKKLIFLIMKPCVVFVVGNERSFVADIIFQIFKNNFKTKKISNNILPFVTNKSEVLIFITDLTDPKNLGNYKFLIEKSRLPIILLTYIGETSEKQTILDQVCKIIKFLPPYGFINISFDDGINRRIKSETSAYVLAYGFQEGANFLVTDVNINGNEANFKVNYEGGIVPFWLRNFSKKEQIYSAIAAMSVAVAKDLNLVKISQKLKDL